MVLADLTLFYATWCGTCMKLKSATKNFQFLEKNLPNHGFNINFCEESKIPRKVKDKIDGYPCLFAGNIRIPFQSWIYPAMKNDIQGLVKVIAQCCSEE